MTRFVEKVVAENTFCPFCENNESSTPPEVLALRDYGSRPDCPGWSLRVVPNKFPALKAEGELERMKNGIYDQMSGVGMHEVLIETPDHNQALATLPVDNISDLFMAVRSRFNVFKSDSRILCAQFFKNHGHEAGASLEHSHSQIIAMPVISRLLGEELAGSKAYSVKHGSCVYCDIIRDEVITGDRIVSENDLFVALAPYASRFAYETWLLPKKHSSMFENSTDDAIHALAEIFKDTAGRVDKLLGSPPYNLMLHTAPFGDPSGADHYHWHTELMPVLGQAAGFEWGAGFHINSVPPEEAAKALRQA